MLLFQMGLLRKKLYQPNHLHRVKELFSIITIMGTIEMWNEMLQTFLDDLGQSFPENTVIPKYRKTLPMILYTNKRIVLDKFIEEVTPIKEKITTRDPSIFKECKNTFLEELKMSELWELASEKSKDAIWSYLNTLLVLGSTISIIPPEAMKTIELLASDMAKNMSSSDGNLLGALDPNMLAGLLGGGIKE